MFMNSESDGIYTYNYKLALNYYVVILDKSGLVLYTSIIRSASALRKITSLRINSTF